MRSGRLIWGVRTIREGCRTAILLERHGRRRRLIPLAGNLFSSFFGRLVPHYDSRLRPMKKILVLLFCVCALLGSVRPAEAGNVSWGIPLPFPFLFYKFGCCGQTNGNGYSKEGAYSNTTVAGFPTRRSCPCIPCWLQYHVEYDCEMRLGQTTSMPGVGGPRD